MNQKARTYWIHALTPLHVGSGRGLGYIDLPLMREKVTNWPLVPGSAVKGVLRDYHTAKGTADVVAAFGRAGDENANSGSLVFTDARLVCLPVRSLYGTFAWCSSPLALGRLCRDLGAAGSMGSLSIPNEPAAHERAYLPQKVKSALSDGQKVYLEDLDFTPEPQDKCDGWAQAIAGWAFGKDETWGVRFQERFILLHSDVFSFLCETATEVAARVCLSDESKTVAEGPWYEESLPAESVLAGLAWCDRVYGNHGVKKDDLLGKFCTGDATLQIGGKATVGRGRVHCLFN